MKIKSMQNLNKNMDDKLSIEIKDSFEFNVSNEFDKIVREEINKRIIQKRLIRRYLLVVGILILFLISVISFYYLKTVNGLIDINKIHYSTGIWRYKYVSIIVLSLSLVFTIDKVHRLKMRPL